MTAYYNEFDEKTAEWLRNLIDEGVVAPGDVDTRSIAEVKASDLDGYTQCHFFAGIGVWSYALRQAGWCDDRPVWTGSCPCQPFSAAGKRGGIEDERHLWPAFFELIRECRPDVVFGEQVSSKDALAWLDHVSTDLEGAHYAVGALDTCAAGFGAPHIRQRLYWVAHTLHARRSEWRSVPWDGPLARRSGVGSTLVNSSSRGAAAGEQPRQLYGSKQTDDRDVSPGVALGDAESVRRVGGSNDRDGGRGECSSRQAGTTCDRRGDVGVAQGDADCERRDGVAVCLLERGPQQDRVEVAGSGDAGVGQADATNERHERGGVARRRRDGPSNGCAVDGVALGDADVTGSQGRSVQPGQRASQCSVRPPGPVNGFWERCDWIPCRDGKARPVEPGTFPLVTGATGRILRLRAYGNSLNAEAAKEFIAAYMSIE